MAKITVRQFSLILAVFVGFSAFAAAATPTPAQVAAESKRFNAFLDRVFDEQVARHPQTAAQLGRKINYGAWDDLSDSQAAIDMAEELKALAAMERDFDYNALDEQSQLSYRLFQRQVDRDTEAFRFRYDGYLINQEFGLHSETPTFLINVHQVATVADAKAYISRTNGVSKLFDQGIALLNESAKRGVIPPRFVFPLVLDTCRKVISGAPFDNGADSALLADFKKKVAALGVKASVKQKLIEEEKEALVTSLGPAYQRLIMALEALEKRATDDAGVWKFPDGDAYYAFQLKNYTTTAKTAAEIHQLGLNEMARIHGEMEQIKNKVGFKGNLQAFFKFMREDPRFYVPDTAEGRAQYLARAEQIIDTMRGRLDELFITKPKAPLVVKAVEPFREKSAGLAFYNRPSPDGSRPGMFYVNLGNLKATPLYSLEALAYHEGIPGHHMQIGIAQELQNIPEFRRFGRFTAYSEGWGLYSELVPKEIGLYQDPYSDFGRLSMELWRAARLVVDTGLHFKRWTRQEAIDYLKQNTPNDEGACVAAINRYIVSAGQATAYKIGQLRILELREEAKKALGPRFDIRKFHEVVLAHGALPLDVLAEQVEAWVRSYL